LAAAEAAEDREEAAWGKEVAAGKAVDAAWDRVADAVWVVAADAVWGEAAAPLALAASVSAPTAVRLSHISQVYLALR
jgi:hypothetical protein